MPNVVKDISTRAIKVHEKNRTEGKWQGILGGSESLASMHCVRRIVAENELHADLF
jgi:hypothetical protein